MKNACPGPLHPKKKKKNPTHILYDLVLRPLTHPLCEATGPGGIKRPPEASEPGAAPPGTDHGSEAAPQASPAGAPTPLKTSEHLEHGASTLLLQRPRYTPPGWLQTTWVVTARLTDTPSTRPLFSVDPHCVTSPPHAGRSNLDHTGGAAAPQGLTRRPARDALAHPHLRPAPSPAARTRPPPPRSRCPAPCRPS